MHSRLIPFIFAVLITIQGAEARCALFLNPRLASVASNETSHLPSGPHVVHGSLSSWAKLDVLMRSEERNFYLQIINNARSEETRKNVVDVLYFLETHGQHRAIGNYDEWLHFLSRSKSAHLEHRLWEGVMASLLLASRDVQITFEPSGGFFSDGSGKAIKSMDLQVVDPESGKVLGYYEVKKLIDPHAVPSALRSVLEKVEKAREFGESDTELSAIIFVDSDPVRTAAGHTTAEADFEHSKETVLFRLERHNRVHPNSKLSELILVHTGLHKFMKFESDADGNVHTEEGHVNPFYELNVD